MSGLDNHLENGISQSALNLIDRSPAHYALRYIKGKKKPPTPAMLLGRAVHTATLQPELFDRQYIVVPDLHKNSKAWKRWAVSHATAKGADWIDQQTRDTAFAIAEVVRAHPIAGPLLAQADYIEHEIKWHDQHTGVLCQGRLDIVTGNCSLVVDLKTARDAREDPFSKSMVDMRYDVQGAFYFDGGREQGWPVEKFLSIAVETEEPYLLATHVIGSETLALARAAYTHDLWLWQQCVASGRWPGLEAKITVVDLPPWGRKIRERTRGGT